MVGCLWVLFVFSGWLSLGVVFSVVSYSEENLNVLLVCSCALFGCDFPNLVGFQKLSCRLSLRV